MPSQTLTEGTVYGFPQPADTSTLVWRYMDLPKLISLLASKTLFLSSIELFSDPHEGSITRPCSEKLAKDSHLLQHAEWRKLIRENVFINCWRLGNEESEAMWQIYCGRNQGVAIQTSYHRLKESIPTDAKLGVGVVSYLDYQTDDMPNYHVYTPVLHKRKAFEHEQEVRIVCSMVSYQSNDFPSPSAVIGQDGKIVGMRLPWSAESVVEKICINPYADQWYRDVVEETVKIFAPALASRTEWSQMRSDPCY